MIEYVKRLAGPFTAEGATNLPFGFKIFDPTDVFVAASTDPNVSSTALVYGRDYSVKMNADQDAVPGGTVVLNSPISSGQVVVIGSAVAYTQNMQLTNFSRFPPEIINESLDRIVVQIQQLVELIGRTISLPPTSNLTVSEFLDNLFNAAKSAAKSAEEAKKFAQICEEIKQNIFIYSWDIPHVVDTLDDVEKYPFDGFFAVGGYGDPGHHGQDISNRFVKAKGSTELRTLGERFSDVVNVKDFGAKGDGVTDDTAAIQAALNSQCSIFFPDGSYVVSSTLQVPFGVDRRNFFGTCKPRSNKKESQRKGAVIFFSQADVGIQIRSSQSQFFNLGFSGYESNERTLLCLNFEKLVNADDVDAHCTCCSFFNAKTACSVQGRSSTVLDNLFVMVSVGVHLRWPSSGYEYEDEAQTPPFANRGIRILRNRKHGLGPLGSGSSALVQNDGDILRSAVISQNVLDVGGTLIRDTKGLENCLITENVVDLSGHAAIISSGNVLNSIITGNSFSFRISKVENSVAPYTYRNLIDLRGLVDGLVVSQNLFAGFSQHAISISASSAKDVCVTNNIIDCSGVTNPSLAYRVGMAITTSVNGLTFTGNVFTGGLTNMSAALAAPSGGIARAIVTTNQLNGLPLASSYGVFSSPIRIENATTKKECIGTTEQGGVLNIGNESENTTVLNFVDRNRDTARIRFTSPDDKLSLSLFSPASADQDASIYSSSEQHTQVALGRPSVLWKEIFSATGTINTSDERAKTGVTDTGDSLMRAWGKVNFKVFQFKDAVEKKGSDARLHVGVIAQQVIEAFASEGLDATRYGLLCYDKWEDEYEDIEVVDTPELVTEDGTVTPAKTHIEHRLVTPAGDRYGIRYEEALALECAYLRRELKQIKQNQWCA